MKTPKSIKGLLSLLINIAEEGNCPRSGEAALTDKESLAVGGIIADIQNSLGEQTELLEKFGLRYNGGLD